MKIRLHKEDHGKGLIVLESEPQIRTIFITSSFKYTERLAFPYVYHIIHYRIIHGKYYYFGIYDRGLMVFMRNKPIRSINSKFCFCPLEVERFGISCTIHEKDQSKYNSIFDLIHDVISDWWQMEHQINDYNAFEKHRKEFLGNLKMPDYNGIPINVWKEKNLENINEVEWSPAFTLKNASKLKPYIPRFDNSIIIYENSKLINKNMPK